LTGSAVVISNSVYVSLSGSAVVVGSFYAYHFNWVLNLEPLNGTGSGSLTTTNYASQISNTEAWDDVPIELIACP
jgi:hypothetical protein